LAQIHGSISLYSTILSFYMLFEREGSSCFSIDRLMDGDAIAIAVAITPIPTIQAIKKIEVESQRLSTAIDFSVKD
jgi:hypothetical protein